MSPLERLLRTLMGVSLVDLLDQVGTADDELMNLKEISKLTPYGTKYLALRCQQGIIPAVKTGKVWQTSKRATKIYALHVARKSGLTDAKRKSPI